MRPWSRNTNGNGSGERGWRRGGESNYGKAKKPCAFFQREQTCKYGSSCRFSHDLSLVDAGKRQGGNRNPIAEETAEQLQARADFNSWKRIIKDWPAKNNAQNAERLWRGALDILNGSEREWKHGLARDLDDETFHGRRHIQETITCAAQAGFNTASFHAMSCFLQAMTHASILDCLSIDACVGSLYNFFSGTNGNRAIPALQVFCEAVLDGLRDMPEAESAAAAAALSTALRELLKREQRARLHDDLPALIDSVEGLSRSLTRRGLPSTSALLAHHVCEIRAVVGRARGLLSVADADAANFADVPLPAYPRGLHMPNDRHDNDKTDIAAMKIFPTRAEIFSDVVEFLPSIDPEQPHFFADKSQRHIDTLFRLLRQDTFGELKDVLASTLRVSEIDRTYLDSPKLSFGNLRANRYPKAVISYISFSGRRGLEADISFSQPSVLRGKSVSERRRWWEDSRRLAEGVLASFIAIHQGRAQHLFLIISNRTIDDGNGSLTKNSNRATMTSRLTSHDQANIETLVGLSSSRAQGVLVEFPGVIPATFVPILENLQKMQCLGSLPFQNWILPDRIEQGHGDTAADIPPPRYARKPGFAFSLKPILKNGSLEAANFSVEPCSCSVSEDLISRVEAETDLDRGQCRALIAALSREFALIQGPPGTGKSYLGIKLMKVLLNCQAKAALGPIVVVCYTNHALDQFLEHLLHEGTKKIIRIGGQSHSHLLEGHNLRTVTQSESKSGWERYNLAKSYEELDSKADSIKRALTKAHGVVRQTKWDNIQKYLGRHYPRIFIQFKDVDADGFKTIGRHPFDIWASFKKDLTDDDIETEFDCGALLGKASRDVHSLSPLERRHLVGFWTTENYKQAVDDLYEDIKYSSSKQRQVSNIHDEVDRRVLQEADVIGITTTGLAKRISTLQRLRCRVVICEEAGEVMEPHMLSALLPNVEHIIQIGDHEQLRPQINNFGLSLESKQGKLYQLDRSQFERLSVGIPGRPKIPVAQLDVQRRMRPPISMLIRETLYPDIQDHPSTRSLPDVVGMRKNLFWLDHDHLEDGSCSEMQHKSHSNAWEASMVHALVRHIVRQGVYNSTDIAVLTPYTGQLQKLRAAMRSDFEIVLSDRDQEALDKDGFDAAAPGPDEDPPKGAPSQRKGGALTKKRMSELLRVATVDNFQGEEAKVVIISLVRSNEARKVGFLKTTNRINVLLSRAQHGMYLIGNSETYANVQMWQVVIGLLRASDSVGRTLELCCPRHEETPIEVSEPDDFPRLSPEGGCARACVWRLPDCGHMCLARCHSESMHNIFPCPQRCQRLHEPCGHGCQKPTCGEDCGKCLVPLKNIELPCGHFKDVATCHAAQNPATIRCQVMVEKTVPGCNHGVEVACFQSVTAAGYLCPVPCTTPLPCAHICPGTCGSCREQGSDATSKSSHQSCRKICMRPFGTCSHHCRSPCHDGTDCGLCVAPCEVRCPHSKCAAACSEGCVPCVEKCEWACEHQGACAMPCAAACNRLPCDERCARLLPCGHRCPSLCGEVCPAGLCKDCGMAHDARVDLLEMKTYAEIDVDLTPIVVLACGHFFTAETLDGLVGMNTVYVTDHEGRFTALADVSGAFARMPQCPDCKRPVRQYATRRYNRIINRAVADESARRFLVAGKSELMALDGELDKLQEDLAASHADVLQSIKNIPEGRPGRLSAQFKNRYHSGQELHSKMSSFCKRSSERYQPSHMLYEATVHALRRRTSDDLCDGLAGLTLDSSAHLVERDRRVAVAGEMALLKLEFLTLEDMLGLMPAIRQVTLVQPPKWPGGSPLLRVKPFLESCASFVSSCCAEALPKIAVEATLYHARMARMYLSCSSLDAADKAKAIVFEEDAKNNLEKASLLCEQPFQDAEKLKRAVEDTIRLLQREWYETVSPEEIADIKEAMVAGRSGLATHSGHWYNCVNGHPANLTCMMKPDKNTVCDW